MDNPTLSPLNIDRLSDYSSWFDNHDAADMLFKQSSVEGLEGNDSKAWTASLNGEVVAVVTFSRSGSTATIYVAVEPSMRRHGIATKLIHEVMALPIFSDVLRVRASIELENIAAQKLVSKSGFVNTGQTEDGLIIFERRA